MADNPFEIFDLPAAFDVDEQALHQKFIALAAANHPDRFTDPIEQAEAAARIASVNGAYRVLTDPQLRANALVELLGGPGSGDDKSLPPDLLMNMMQTREQMDEAIEANDRETIKQLGDDAHAQRRAYLDAIGKQFAAQPSPQVLKQIRLQLNALRYYERMIEQLPY